jgi:dienelactone hydrolase
MVSTLEDRIALLAPAADWIKPEGPGPHPLCILLHGCGGRRGFMDEWAERLKAAGWGALIVDSLKPRRISRVAALAGVCTGTLLQGRERAGDLYAAFAWAKRQDWVDPNRIATAGWSHGSWTILDALALKSGAEMARATSLSDLAAEPLDGLAAAMLFYPYAGVASLAGKRDWRIAPPASAIICGQDYMVGTDTPRRAIERQIARGAEIDLHFFKDATHAFDEGDARDFRVRYDPAAIAQAEAIFLKLLARV